MKLRLRKTQRKRRVKRKTSKRQKGGNSLIVKYDDILVQGQELEKTKTVSTPSIKFPTTGKLYTLVMWDPDVPPISQPGFVHWIVTNLQSQNNIHNNQLLEYKGPNPPSGTHRYYFGLFEQQGHILVQQPERPNFDINIFVKENNLKKISEAFMKVSAI